MPAVEYIEFYSDGFGFVCRRCENELKSLTAEKPPCRSRFMREGEAESKTPEMSNGALAKWMDKAQTMLICPRCGITEKVE
jgi:hypothetical protein